MYVLHKYFLYQHDKHEFYYQPMFSAIRSRLEFDDTSPFGRLTPNGVQAGVLLSRNTCHETRLASERLRRRISVRQHRAE